MPFHIIREGDAPPAEGRPQDPHLDGRDLKFETLEHGGAEPDTMPNAIRVRDPQGRVAIYVFKEIEMETNTEVLTGSELRLADAEQVRAAAPDMLAALKEMLRWMPSGFAPQSKSQAMQMARDAIDKAEGRAPIPPVD